MATKIEVQEFVEQYQQTNERPCPKKAIIAAQGEGAESVLKELIADGTLACRRGRNGGYYPVTAAAQVAVESEQTDTPVETASEVDTDALAEQFRALEARLAAEEAAQNETPADEPAPF